MDKYWRMCLNWRVIAAVSAVGVALLLFAPHLATSALPVLFVAICPLSMLLMMRAMQGDRAPSQPKQAVGSNEATSREPLAELKGEAARLHEQEEALERQIAELERAGRPHDHENRPTTSA